MNQGHAHSTEPDLRPSKGMPIFRPSKGMPIFGPSKGMPIFGPSKGMPNAHNWTQRPKRWLEISSHAGVCLAP